MAELAAPPKATTIHRDAKDAKLDRRPGRAMLTHWMVEIVTDLYVIVAIKIVSYSFLWSS